MSGSITTYRAPSELTVVKPPKLSDRYERPQWHCPACGDLVIHNGDPFLSSKPRYCGPKKRRWVGWFRRCKEHDVHMHQRCKMCGYRWTANMKDTSERLKR